MNFRNSIFLIQKVKKKRSLTRNHQEYQNGKFNHNSQINYVKSEQKINRFKLNCAPITEEHMVKIINSQKSLLEENSYHTEDNKLNLKDSILDRLKAPQGNITLLQNFNNTNSLIYNNSDLFKKTQTERNRNQRDDCSNNKFLDNYCLSESNENSKEFSNSTKFDSIILL